jgi:hypothetical protein
MYAEAFCRPIWDVGAVAVGRTGDGAACPQGRLPALQPNRRDREDRRHPYGQRLSGRMSGSAYWTTFVHNGPTGMRRTVAGHSRVRAGPTI